MCVICVDYYVFGEFDIFGKCDECDDFNVYDVFDVCDLNDFYDFYGEFYISVSNFSVAQFYLYFGCDLNNFIFWICWFYM